MSVDSDQLAELMNTVKSQQEEIGALKYQLQAALNRANRAEGQAHDNMRLADFRARNNGLDPSDFDL